MRIGDKFYTKIVIPSPSVVTDDITKVFGTHKKYFGIQIYEYGGEYYFSKNYMRRSMTYYVSIFTDTPIISLKSEFREERFKKILGV